MEGWHGTREALRSLRSPGHPRYLARCDLVAGDHSGRRACLALPGACWFAATRPVRPGGTLSVWRLQQSVESVDRGARQPPGGTEAVAESASAIGDPSGPQDKGH